MWKTAAVLAFLSCAIGRSVTALPREGVISAAASDRTRVHSAAAYSASAAALSKVSDEFGRIFAADEPPKVELHYFDAAASSLPVKSVRAVYVDRKIFIGISSKPEEKLQLERTIRHEYTHALIAQFSAGRCPAWLDEGLAQYMEGLSLGDEARSYKLLEDWVRSDNLFSLRDLRKGFSSFSEPLARVAYAQSYFAARTLVFRFGISRVTGYLRALGAGADAEQIFAQAFEAPFEDFDRDLLQLKYER